MASLSSSFMEQQLRGGVKIHSSLRLRSHIGDHLFILYFRTFIPELNGLQHFVMFSSGFIHLYPGISQIGFHQVLQSFHLHFIGLLHVFHHIHPGISSFFDSGFIFSATTSCNIIEIIFTILSTLSY